jgi:4-hydroxybenzoate polyprenyltransferase
MKIFEAQYASALAAASFVILFLPVLFVVRPWLALAVSVIGGLAIWGHAIKVREERRKERQYRKNTYGF